MMGSGKFDQSYDLCREVIFSIHGLQVVEHFIAGLKKYKRNSRHQVFANSG